MVTVRLKATAKDGSIEESVDLTFSSDEIEKLEQFIENFDRFRSARLLENGIPALKRISQKEGAGLCFEFTKFDTRDVYEFLHIARPILLFREPASFEKTCAIIGKKSGGTALAKHIKSLRNKYEIGHYQPYFQIAVNDIPLFHDNTLKVWLNGVEYHQDTEKREQVKALEKAITPNVARAVFVSQLSGKIESIFLLAEVVNLILKKPEA